MSHSPWLLTFAVFMLLMPLWHGLWNLWRRSRQRRELQQRAPADWQANLQAHSAIYRRMPLPARDTTLLLARQFERAKHFEACNGLVLAPLMRQLVSFNACVLAQVRGLPIYDALQSVLLYPGEFVVTQTEVDAAGVVSESRQALTGQAIETGRIVLSWPDVLAATGADGGYNVVIHECAHHLDHSLDGLLSAPDAGSSWQTLLQREYAALCDAAERDEETLLDPYGSEDPAEFFAVATEAFIECPGALRARHAGLYAALTRLYGFSPADWGADNAAGSCTRHSSTAPATKNTTSDTMP